MTATPKWYEKRYCDCDGEYGASPARPGLGPDTEPGWVRCWVCGGLWDADGNDVIAEYGEEMRRIRGRRR